MNKHAKSFVFENAWVCEECASADLGDKRLDKRMAKVLDRISSRPTVSIPAACRGWAETQAAYRFFDNEAVTEHTVLAPHRQASIEREQRKSKAFEDKESRHWLTGYPLACSVAEQAPDTQVVSVADREGDIYEIFAAALPEEGRRKAAFIVRAQHNRAVAVDEETGKLWDKLACRHILGYVVILVPGTPKRKARKAKLTVQALTVQPRVPYRPEGKLPAVNINAVLIREGNPPVGEEPIEWLLLTNLPVSTLAEASLVVEHYGCRWMIEVFFRVLKTGCLVEERQLELTDRLRPCIALLMIVAWRVLYVTWMGRTYPNLSCEAIFAPEEWKSVWTVVTSKPLPKQPPTLSEFIAMVASLGGHLGRKYDGDPGTQTIWIGMQRLHDFARAWLAFGPGQPP